MTSSTTTTRSNLSGALVRIARVVGPLLFWGLLWEAAALIVQQPVLLPTPLAVFAKLCSFVVDGDYWLTILWSFLRIFSGYALGCVIGFLIAFGCSRSAIVRGLLLPLLGVVRSVPVASFIILALVWIGRTNVPVFISFLMVLPIVAGNVYEGFRQYDRQLAEVASVFRFSFAKRFRTVELPAVIPYFVSAAKTALGLAWKAGVAAEVLCSLRESIGGRIYDSKVYLETDSLFAWTITVIVISMTIEKLIFRKTDSGASGKRGTANETDPA